MSDESRMKDVLRATCTLLARIEQRDAQMQAAFDRTLQAVGNDAAQVHQRLDVVVRGARTRISAEARAALDPVAAECGRAMNAASTQLQAAARTVWTWYAGLVGLGLLLAVIAWGVLGYYQRELERARDELARYDNAIPVLRAFRASDAIVCGGRICVDVDKGAHRHGDRQQYAPARLSAEP